MTKRRGNKRKGARGRGSAPEPAATETPPSGSPRRRTARVLVATIVLLGALAALVLFEPSGGSLLAPRPLNVVVVTADTLRADRLGAYGSRSVATPNLDRLAASGVLFDNAATAAPITLPAHASIFTGTYPLFHGVHENGGRPLAEEKVTLAEALGAEGYATGAFVGAFVLDGRFGLQQGFDRYDDDMGDRTERRGDAVLGAALDWMDSVRDRRFFSWIHLFDPHAPYDPPEPFRSRYGPSIDGLYDGEVAYVDDLVGQLLDWLDDRDLAESTLVVFLSDHGESLGEHGELTHGFFVYGATMRVPLILRAPGFGEPGERVEAQVRTIDVTPTILEILGVEPSPETQGVSLVALTAGGDGAPSLEAYGESMMPRHYGWSELRSLRTSEYQYIEAPRPELYDVVDDPRETENLARSRAATVQRMRERTRDLEASLAAAASSGQQAAAAPVDPGAAAKLAALGYLGSGASPRVEPGAALADPKDKIGLFNRIREAAAAADSGEGERALSLLQAAVDEDPDVVESHNLIGRVQSELGHPDRAADAYRRALELDPAYVPSLLGLAQAYLALGREVDAVAGLERVLELAPGTARAATLLAELHVDAGRYDEGLRVLDRELGGDLDVPGAHYVRGVALEKRGELDGAIEELEKELRISPDDYRAHFELAKLLGQRGRGAEMLAHLEKAVDANPRFAPARFYFANALLEAGQPERAVDQAKQGLAAEPDPALAPFGHFILADAYGRLGRNDDATRELKKAQALQNAPH